MGTKSTLDMRDERAQRAALRETVLQYGRHIGWPTRSAIAFTERLTRRPWKRCTSDQLWTVLGELDALLGASLAPDQRRNGSSGKDGRRSRKEALHAHRD